MKKAPDRFAGTPYAGTGGPKKPMPPTKPMPPRGGVKPPTKPMPPRTGGGLPVGPSKQPPKPRTGGVKPPRSGGSSLWPNGPSMQGSSNSVVGMPSKSPAANMDTMKRERVKRG